MTQEQVGDATGLTSVHVNRTLQSMRSEGLVTTSKQRVTIADWAGLQTAGDFSRAYLHQSRQAAWAWISRPPWPYPSRFTSAIAVRLCLAQVSRPVRNAFHPNIAPQWRNSWKLNGSSTAAASAGPKRSPLVCPVQRE